MNFVTKSVTTYFFASFSFLIHGLKPVFLPLYVVEGGIYGAYTHGDTYKQLISLLKEPVFEVVTKVVTIFSGGRLC
jgi:hypothetical protein